MFAQPKRKSKSSKDKVKHERSSSGSVKLKTENVAFKIQRDLEAEKQKITTDIVVAAAAAAPAATDDNSNTKLTNPLSRDISIEGQIPLDTQIEQGIMNLLEKEMSRVDKKQYPPRPQSLSFYEDEFTADDTDLTGQLQALSPAEKQAYVQRTNYKTINANMEMVHAHNKSPRPDDHSLGDSREKIVTEQSKRIKKQKRGASAAKKTRRNNQSFFNEGYQPRTEITMALDDLQDDVFDSPAPIHGYNYGDSPTSPHYGGISPPVDIPTKIFIDNYRFNTKLYKQTAVNSDADINLKRSFSDSSNTMIPLDIAILLQRVWMPFTTFCHGLLAGVALMNLLILYVYEPIIQNDEFIIACIKLSEYYKILFFILCIICIVSVCDRYDLAHLDCTHIQDLLVYRKSCLVVPIYLLSFALFLAEVNTSGRYQIIDKETINIIKKPFNVFIFPTCTTIGVVLGWLILACSKTDDLLGIHLDSMTKYGNDIKN